MNILITGVAGFIVFSLANNLLKVNNKIKIYGIENYDNYYSKKFKNIRIKELKKSRNFKFLKIDITNRNLLKKKHHLRGTIMLSFSTIFAKKIFWSQIQS